MHPSLQPDSLIFWINKGWKGNYGFKNELFCPVSKQLWNSASNWTQVFWISDSSLIPWTFDVISCSLLLTTFCSPYCLKSPLESGSKATAEILFTSRKKYTNFSEIWKRFCSVWGKGAVRVLLYQNLILVHQFIYCRFCWFLRLFSIE